ncbi:hypothetical protein BU16DRAFT_97408 [Lophium mytilinum]|uniref:Uncharacterized protein n=1 Tax=Lophium mytilinum TaxID=390894 RepID=A0A6A6QQF1_9PEZI|nr:hypothetical protein BU16DRAFT_97408 [Lophium mytilinum]
MLPPTNIYLSMPMSSFAIFSALLNMTPFRNTTPNTASPALTDENLHRVDMTPPSKNGHHHSDIAHGRQSEAGFQLCQTVLASQHHRPSDTKAQHLPPFTTVSRSHEIPWDPLNHQHRFLRRASTCPSDKPKSGPYNLQHAGKRLRHQISQAPSELSCEPKHLIPETSFRPHQQSLYQVGNDSMECVVDENEDWQTPPRMSPASGPGTWPLVESDWVLVQTANHAESELAHFGALFIDERSFG